MDDEEPQKTYPLSPAKMSKTPSWVMLGFLLGAAFVWGFKRDMAKPTAVAPVTLTQWPKAVKVPPSPLTTIEAVFVDWGKYAVWDGDIAEVALWRSETRGFTECYEVRRWDGIYYFRSIPKLTRRIIRHGVVLPDSPLQFTETEEQYREWLDHGRFERTEEPTLQPTLLGPALVPAGEGIPKVKAPKRTPVPPPEIRDITNPR
jgi:hypothetical protein